VGTRAAGQPGDVLGLERRWGDPGGHVLFALSRNPRFWRAGRPGPESRIRPGRYPSVAEASHRARGRSPGAEIGVETPIIDEVYAHALRGKDVPPSPAGSERRGSQSQKIKLLEIGIINESPPVQITKAVITAAGKKPAHPAPPILGGPRWPAENRPGHHHEEVLKAGIQEVCVVICPGDQPAYRAAAGPHANRLQFRRTTRPAGLRPPPSNAPRAFTAAAPFLLLVGDHLYVSRAEKNCAQQLVEAAAGRIMLRFSRPGHAREQTAPSTAHWRRPGSQGRQRLYQIDTVLEKPTATEAQQR